MRTGKIVAGSFSLCRSVFFFLAVVEVGAFGGSVATGGKSNVMTMTGKTLTIFSPGFAEALSGRTSQVGP